jgi:MFS family permease
LSSSTNKEAVKVTVAATVGALIDFYDLYIAGFAAAVAWPITFFPQTNPALAAAGAMGAYGATYLMRPLGSFLFGHVGDRLGRRTTLVWSLVLMGVGVLGVAVTPTYATIGMTAPVLVVIFRLFQGLGLGGECGGAVSWVAEFAAKSKWRTFWTSWLQAAPIMGTMLSSLAFWIVSTNMSNADLVSYGWRMIFLVGVAGVLVAGIIRVKTFESPLFQEALRKKALAKLPSVDVLKSQWKKIFVIMIAIGPSNTLLGFIISPFSVQYLTALKVDTVTVASFLTLVSIPMLVMHALGGVLSSVIRKKALLLILSNILLGAFVIPYFYLLGTKSLLLIFLALLLFEVVPRFGAATMPAITSDYFETKYRASGSGLAQNFSTWESGVIVSLLFPQVILFAGGVIGAVPYVIALWILVMCVPAVIAASRLKDVHELTD